MNLEPTGQGSVVFNVTFEGTRSDVGSATITILRNGIATTVPVAIDESVVGRYVGTFDVPANWLEYDLIHATFILNYMLGTLGRELECTKPVGVVSGTPLSVEFIADLLVADQVKVGNVLRYYQAGTNQTVLLHEQTQTGDPCDGDVKLVTTP